MAETAINRTEQVLIEGVYLPRLPQRQDSLLSQVIDLHAVANRLGMYDAADWIDARLRDAASGRRSLAERHQEHYRTCNCLGNSAECCVPDCECHGNGRNRASDA